MQIRARSHAHGEEVEMGRFAIGFIGANTSQRRTLFVTNVWNPSGDWGAAYMLAHPFNPGADLVCDFHSKVFNPATGVFDYSVTVTNRGPASTFFAIDF
jgi:hypothetical protein